MLDSDQTRVLREILQTSLTQLRIESARADSWEYREKLHQRERIVAGLLFELTGEEPRTELPPSQL